jgi:hypothetical protein
VKRPLHTVVILLGVGLVAGILPRPAEDVAGGRVTLAVESDRGTSGTHANVGARGKFARDEDVPGLQGCEDYAFVKRRQAVGGRDAPELAGARVDDLQPGVGLRLETGAAAAARRTPYARRKSSRPFSRACAASSSPHEGATGPAGDDGGGGDAGTS